MNSLVYEIPTSRRVGALVYDGSADMRLFRGPGDDRELDRAWGGGLQKALDTERQQQGGEPLPLGAVIRVHYGRLHCNFLLWAVTTPAVPRTEIPTAPSQEAIHDAVVAALEFVAERSIERVAFPALGGGEGAATVEERLLTIARAAHAYAEARRSAGKSTVLEEVIICEPNGKTLRAVERKASEIVQRLNDGQSGTSGGSPFQKTSRASGSSATRGTSARSASARTSTGGGRRPRKPVEPPPQLSAEEIKKGRAAAGPYETRRKYSEGDWIKHSKFGLGRVHAILEKRAMNVLFEDQSLRKMVHSRG